MKKHVFIIFLLSAMFSFNVNAYSLQQNIKSADKVKGAIKTESGLVKLSDLDSNFLYDIRYATKNNFTGEKLYSDPICLVNINTARKLIKADSIAKGLGYKLLIYDAYRPLSVQKKMWKIVKNKNFVADPSRGSNHNRGTAVDITLVNTDGTLVPMPGNYDEFSERSNIHYKKCPQSLIKNRELLASIMIKAGFTRISSEWWHFDDKNSKKYKVLDVPFDDFK